VSKKEDELKKAPLSYEAVRTKKFLKKDSYFSAIYEKKMNEKTRNLLEGIFRVKYNDISKDDLHLFCENILERLYVLKKHLPKNLLYLLKGIINHSNISVIDKSNLETALNWHDINENSINDSPLVSVNPVTLKGEEIPLLNESNNYEEFRKRLKYASLPITEHIVNEISRII